MGTFTMWLKLCDWVTGFVCEGMMTDDFPEYDWVGAWEWGCTPQRAVSGAVMHAYGASMVGPPDTP